MSKNIVIQEGGQSSTLSSVSKLKTELVGGGSCTWVPEDETQLESKHITENGTYYPVGYGFFEVTVNVSQSYVSGTGQDGNEYVVSVDETTDELIETLVPSSIRIITPPTKTEYIDGSAIDISGIVVKAYDKNGSLWTDIDHPDGVIDLSELSLVPSVAKY